MTPKIAKFLGAAVIGTAFTASFISHAGASPMSSPAPQVLGCVPVEGTILSTKAIAYSRAWINTNVSSSYAAGPGIVTLSQTRSSSVTATISASFSFDASALFASANSSYGVSLAQTASSDSTWSYSMDVPSGKTAKVQQYHEGADVGIRTVREILLSATKCGTQTDTSSTGNFFPTASTQPDSYCYALLSASLSADIEVGAGCSNRL